MSTTYSRRRMIGMGLSGITALATLAGCDPSTPSTGMQNSTSATTSTSGPAALTMFFWGSATRDKLTTQAINLFHQAHPEITISSQYSGNDTYYTKLNQKIGNGAAPDLIQMDMRYIAQYVRKGALLDLSQLIYNQTIDLSDFDPIILDSSKVNNSIYGVPLGSNYQCMFYDTTQIAKTGLGPLPQNATWEVFAEYTAELTKALGNGTYGTADYSGNYDCFEIWVRQRGKEMYTREGSLAFDLTDATDWLTYWSNLRKNNACPPASVQAKLDLTGTPSDSSVIKGKTVFSHLFSNQYEAFQAALPHPLAMLVFPKGSAAGIYLKASQLLSVSASSKYQLQAASFASFAVTNPGAVKALGLERGIPDSAQSLAMLQPQLTPTQQQIVNFMNEVKTNGDSRVKEVLDPPGAGEIATILQQVALDIGNGKASVTDGAKTFFAGAQKATA